MTALGIALTVAVVLAIMSMVQGLKTALSTTGDPLHVLVLRKGANSELVSNFTREAFQTLKDKAGIARDSSGNPLASLELVSVVNLVSVDAPDGMNINIRGLEPVGIQMRKGLKLNAGRWFETGKREVVVGEAIAKRYPDARLGRHLHFGTGDWEVVGVMSSGQSATNSEIFADLNQLSSDNHRIEVLSSALVQASDPVTASALVKAISSDQQMNMDAEPESAYYAAQESSGRLIQVLGTLVGVIMAVGSSFAAMNTMYAAVARRSKEIGTLRVLGFSRFSILLSFLSESLLLAILGGVLGCLLVLPLNGTTTGIGNFTTFSETDFNLTVTPSIMITGVVFAIVMGALGGLFPAWNAARKQVLTALRAV
ncbi:MAG TPA: ABC transporter permease [Terriglobia bacterium]|nr:ABC transporter permease [Terriglobia bacterium]